MDLVEEFNEMSFVDQELLLQDIQNSLQTETLPELYSVFSKPATKTPVQFKIENTITTLLSYDEKETVKGIYSSDPAIRKLCIRVCGKQGFQSGISPLLKLMSMGMDNETHFEILTALSSIRNIEFLQVFRNNINHAYSPAAIISITMAGKYRDTKSVDQLISIVQKYISGNGQKENIVSAAIAALGDIGSEKSVSYLVSVIDTDKPELINATRNALVRVGDKAIEFLEPELSSEEPSRRMSAAKVLGKIRTKNAGFLLMESLENENDEGVKAVIYTALGNFMTMKAVVNIINGLDETHESVLDAVVMSLETKCCKGIVKAVKKSVLNSREKCSRIMKAVIKARAETIAKFMLSDDDTGICLENEVRETGDESVKEWLYSLQEN